jgi:hypothetical protein
MPHLRKPVAVRSEALIGHSGPTKGRRSSPSLPRWPRRRGFLRRAGVLPGKLLKRLLRSEGPADRVPESLGQRRVGAGVDEADIVQTGDGEDAADLVRGLQTRRRRPRLAISLWAKTIAAIPVESMKSHRSRQTRTSKSSTAAASSRFRNWSATERSSSPSTRISRHPESRSTSLILNGRICTDKGNLQIDLLAMEARKPGRLWPDHLSRCDWRSFGACPLRPSFESSAVRVCQFAVCETFVRGDGIRRASWAPSGHLAGGRRSPEEPGRPRPD